MAAITDEFMRQMLPKARTYVAVILKAAPNWNIAGVEKIIWEHGRRNFALRADGLLSTAGFIFEDGLSGICPQHPDC